jgi:hypothetical protein
MMPVILPRRLRPHTGIHTLSIYVRFLVALPIRMHIDDPARDSTSRPTTISHHPQYRSSVFCVSFSARGFLPKTFFSMLFFFSGLKAWSEVLLSECAS